MKRTLILLTLIILAKIISFSYPILINDSIVIITSQQLKQTNLIFTEHDKLKIENSLLNEQVNNYISEVNYLENCDSLKTLQLKNYKDLNLNYKVQLDDTFKELQNKNKVINGWRIGFISVSLGFLVLLLIR